MAEPEADFLHGLASVVSAWGMYPPSHPLAKEPLAAFAAAIEARLTEGDRAATTLLVVDDDLVLDGEAERTANLYLDSLRRAFKRCRLERLSLLSGLTAEELAALVSGLAGRAPLAASGHVVLGRVVMAGEEAATTAAGEGLDESHLEAVLGALRRLAADEPRAFEALDHAVWELLEATARPGRRFLLQAELPSHLFGHCRHAVAVGLHTLALGRALTLGDGLLHGIALGALVHDLGLWRMPAVMFEDPVLSEPAQAALHLHPELGALRLAALPGAPEMALLIAYEHHRWWNGLGGYPAEAARPGLGAQLTAVADVWDLALNRPGAGSPRQRRHLAAQELRLRAGRELHPDLVSLFLGEMEPPSR